MGPSHELYFPGEEVYALLARASFVTQDANDLKQTLAANGVPEVVTYNRLAVSDPEVDINLATGEVTFHSDFSGVASISVGILRELTGSGNIEWGVFVQAYDPVNEIWVPYEGSLRPITMSTQTSNEKRVIDYSLAVELKKEQKFRFMHYTTDASKTVSIVSFGATGLLPSSAGVIVSLFGIIPT
ncbi:hypothetical protein [Shewanella khirikhana]|uniref:Uncharacterized protein n=1 Tax=Shewanella khirikhana TaxID=1965282 RepID=A0ABM7D158_9GAMM|nr:hypothetical protein [Shewanella khirikhana]AZQ10157.1 hypothetical protein STH12_01021 [Shewanella khirikhana]